MSNPAAPEAAASTNPLLDSTGITPDMIEIGAQALLTLELEQAGRPSMPLDQSRDQTRLRGQAAAILAVVAGPLRAGALRDAASSASRPANGAPYEVWAWFSQWMRDSAAQINSTPLTHQTQESQPATSTSPETTASESTTDDPLPFTWDYVGTTLLVRDKNATSCHPAGYYEIRMIEEIERLRAERATR